MREARLERLWRVFRRVEPVLGRSNEDTHEEPVEDVEIERGKPSLWWKTRSAGQVVWARATSKAHHTDLVRLGGSGYIGYVKKLMVAF